MEFNECDKSSYSSFSSSSSSSSSSFSSVSSIEDIAPGRKIPKNARQVPRWLKAHDIIDLGKKLDQLKLAPR